MQLLQAVVILIVVPGSEGGCLTVTRHAHSGEMRFGNPETDNYCRFAQECFGLTCPLADVAEWPMREDTLREDMPQNACARVRLGGCAKAYLKAEQDCVGDELSRLIWDGHQKGYCVQCQRLVEIYRRLRKRCPLADEWEASLRNMFADFVHVEPEQRIDVSGQLEGMNTGWRNDLTADL